MTNSKNIPKANLSYKQISELNPGWVKTMVKDYAKKQESIDSIDTNLNDLQEAIDENADAIATNSSDIATNSSDIATNSSDISTNSSDIATNSSDISQNSIQIINHISDDSAHGVNGSNVGTGNYCTESTGGVVNLASLVSDLNQITTPDLSSAPALYDQSYTQSMSDLINEEKSKINEIINKINEIISGQQLSKQMSLV